MAGNAHIDLIHRRRSHKKLVEPAPSDAELEQILRAATTAPDHKELRPWHFVVLKGKARATLGEAMASALVARDPAAETSRIDKERAKPLRSPLVIAVGARRKPHKLAFSELVHATAAATQNLLLAAEALGYGAIWKSGDAARDHEVKMALGFGPDDELLGFIHLGTKVVDLPPNEGNLEACVTWLES